MREVLCEMTSQFGSWLAVLMRIFQVVAVAISCALATDLAAKSSAQVCSSGLVTVTGTVRSLSVTRKEPKAPLQTHFVLESPSCGFQSITVSLKVRTKTNCLEGDLARVHGEYYAPVPPVGVPILDRAKVECRRR